MARKARGAEDSLIFRAGEGQRTRGISPLAGINFELIEKPLHPQELLQKIKIGD